jgi:hypothetical protein
MIVIPIIVYPRLSDLIFFNISPVISAPVRCLLSFEPGKSWTRIRSITERLSLFLTSLPPLAHGLTLLPAFHLRGDNRGYHSPLIQHDDLGSACSPEDFLVCAGWEPNILSIPLTFWFKRLYSCLSLVCNYGVYQQFKYFNHITILSSPPVWH